MDQLDFIDMKDSQKKRFQFFNKCDIDSLYNYFSKSIKSGKTAFQIPHEIDQAAGGEAEKSYRWIVVKKYSNLRIDPKQMYLSVRSSQRGKTTLSTSLSTFKARPGIVFCIEQDDKPQVMHLLQEQNVILYARKGDGKFHST